MALADVRAVNVDKYVDKAHTRGADVVQLDLEDSVPPAEKDKARTLVEKAAAKVQRGGADVVVRFNQPLSMAVRDLEHSICPDVDALACTKVGGVSHVHLLDELVSELEEKRGMTVGHTKFITMIETADAFFHIRDIVRAASASSPATSAAKTSRSTTTCSPRVKRCFIRNST